MPPGADWLGAIHGNVPLALAYTSLGLVAQSVLPSPIYPTWSSFKVSTVSPFHAYSLQEDGDLVSFRYP